MFISNENISSLTCVLEEPAIVHSVSRGVLANQWCTECVTLEDPILKLYYKPCFVPLFASNGSMVRSRIVEIVRTNSLDAAPFKNGIYIFPHAVFFQNSTNPNCEYFITKCDHLVIMTKCDVKAGEALTINRTWLGTKEEKTNRLKKFTKQIKKKNK